MTELLLKYDCEEYLNEYYSNGLFHPTECQNFFPHSKAKINNTTMDLEIGEIWDDHDLIICYRPDHKGLWGRFNYDGSYSQPSTSLKEQTEGFYKFDSHHWGKMTQEVQWKGIINFYQSNIDRYNWNPEQLLAFIELCVQANFDQNFYIKAYKTHFDITAKNGFSGRAFENMVRVCAHPNSKDNELTLYYQPDFFNGGECKIVSKDMISRELLIIDNWITKSA